ncbi:hypothetical protein FF1_008341 [Malus domestica]
MAFDPLLLCEEGFEEYLGDNGSEEESENCDGFSKKQSSFPLIFLESDMFWENDELSSLISKEEQTHVHFSGEISDRSLMAAWKEPAISKRQAVDESARRRRLRLVGRESGGDPYASSLRFASGGNKVCFRNGAFGAIDSGVADEFNDPKFIL